MYIKTISALYERKLNIKLIDPRRDYESATLKAEAWADVKEDEKPAEQFEALQTFLKEQVKEQALDLIEAVNKGRNSHFSLITIETAFYEFMKVAEASKEELTPESAFSAFEACLKEAYSQTVQ